MSYLLGIDIGTSGTKTILVNSLGNELASSTAEYPLYQRQNGWAEQEPLDWWQATVKTCREVLLKSGVNPGNNMGILPDTHHANIEELDVVDAYVKHVDRIFDIHISENNRGIPGSGHGIPPQLFKALEKAGYKGNLIIEAFNPDELEVLPLLRIWAPFAKTKDEIALKSLEFIKANM